MLEIKVDGVEPLLEKLGKYGKQIDELHKTMPEELVTWQRDDMRRKYPNVTVDARKDETAATTLIWPTSRFADPNKRRRAQGPKQYRPAARGPVVRSTRPILRAKLLEQLWDRMRTLVAEAMKWP
jgi:hypothetical protein